MNWWLVLAVFATDAVISFLGWARLDEWLCGRRSRVLALSLLLDLAIAVNTLGFIEVGWWMLVPSLLGSSVGTMLSFRYRPE